VLLIFNRKIYPTINPEPERRLVERLREAIFEDREDLDSSTAVVASLANATGLLPVHFAKKELKRRKRRLEQISNGDLGGAAAAEAVQAAQAAALAAVMVATTVATTSS